MICEVDAHFLTHIDFEILVELASENQRMIKANDNSDMKACVTLTSKYSEKYSLKQRNIDALAKIVF